MSEGARTFPDLPIEDPPDAPVPIDPPTTLDEIEAAASDTPAERPSQQRVITREQYVLDTATLVKRVMAKGGIKDGVAFNIVMWGSDQFRQELMIQARQAEAAAAAEVSDGE